MSEISDGVREAAMTIISDWLPHISAKGDAANAIGEIIQRLAVAPAEAERDKARADYRAEVDLCTDRTIERDEARAELERVRRELQVCQGKPMPDLRR